jgi:hypothetical protein
MPTGATHKTESDSLVQIDDLLPLIAQARQIGDPLDLARVRRLSSKAAAALGAMPKGRRKVWTGWLDGTHFWRGRKAVLPGGQVVVVEGILRGEALISWDDPLWLEGVRRQVVRVEQLSVYKTPPAVWLGKLKFGRAERKSAAKAAAAHRNGHCPCAPGKRRGRPCKPFQPTTPDAHQSLQPTGPMPGTPCALDFASAVKYYSRPQSF